MPQPYKVFYHLRPRQWLWRLRAGLPSGYSLQQLAYRNYGLGFRLASSSSQ